MTARELRMRGRAALRKKWLTAVLVSLVAGLLGGSLSIGILSDADWGFDNKGLDRSAASDRFVIDMPYDGMAQERAEAVLTQFIQKIDDLMKNMDPSVRAFLYSIINAVRVLWIICCIYGLITLFIGSAAQIGEARYYLMLQTEDKPTFGVLFSRMGIWLKAVWLTVLTSVLCLLWSLLLIFPGIIAAYRYSMARNLLAEDPDMSARDAIRLSKEIMKGNKWRLFCLELSFIGWALLSLITFGIGFLFLRPYIRSSIAAFYLEARGYDGDEDDNGDKRGYVKFEPGDM